MGCSLLEPSQKSSCGRLHKLVLIRRRQALPEIVFQLIDSCQRSTRINHQFTNIFAAANSASNNENGLVTGFADATQITIDADGSILFAKPNSLGN
jgi:hypothetical protein